MSKDIMGRRRLGSLSYQSKLYDYDESALELIKSVKSGDIACNQCLRTVKDLHEDGLKSPSVYHDALSKGKPYTKSDLWVLCEDCAKSFGFSSSEVDLKIVSRGIRDTMLALGLDLEDENFSGTPGRVSKFLLGHFVQTHQLADELSNYANSSFPSRYYGIISQSGIRGNSLCPHHLLPVIYSIDVAYIPDGRAIGLSKLSRIVKVVSNVPMLQEDMTEEIRLQISRAVSTPHVAVVVRGQHTCMSTRGVKSEVSTTTSSMTGDFYDDPVTRSETLSLFQNGKRDLG